MELIKPSEFKKICSDCSALDKKSQIKETILENIQNEISGNKVKEIYKKKTDEVKKVKPRSNIKKLGGKTYYNLKYGTYSFGAVKLDENNINGDLLSLIEYINKGNLDSEITSYINSDDFKKLQTRFSK